jgi:hypothetical protein
LISLIRSVVYVQLVIGLVITVCATSAIIKLVYLLADTYVVAVVVVMMSVVAVVCKCLLLR